MSESIERMSSGLRINRPDDDAAGLAISQSLQKDTRVYSQAIRNISDGISYLNIAQGSLQELSKITTRLMELSEQSSNGTFSWSQRRSMDGEADALVREYNRIVSTTAFNGRRILLPSEGGVRIQAGYGIDGSITADMLGSLQRTVGTGNFTQTATFSPSVTGLNDLRMADVNGDGAQDLISAGETVSTNGFVAVQLNNGDGTFKAESAYDMNGGSVRTLSIGDLDGDGFLDLVAGGNDGSAFGEVTVRLNRGDGTFGAIQTYTTEWTVTEASALADLNHDGRLDIITTSGDHGSELSILINRGDGTFNPRLSYAVNTFETFSVEAADLNGDGNTDIVIGSGSELVLFLGNSDGSMRSGNSSLSWPSQTRPLSLADVNGDAYLDVISAEWDAGVPSGVSVLINDGHANFAKVNSVPLSWGAYANSVGDINNDGNSDILVMDDNWLGVGMFVTLGNGDGSFRAVSSSTVFNDIGTAATLGDLNGDGCLDIALAGYSMGNAEIKLMTANTEGSTFMPFLNLSTQASSRQELDELTTQLGRIDAELGNIGSFLSRLQTASANTWTLRENSAAAQSRIVDADIASESSAFLRNQIVEQAAAAVLGQANQMPALALKLLRG